MTLGIMKAAIAIIFGLILATPSFAAEEAKHNYKPVAGYVPAAETAIRIALAVWEPIYGRKQIEGQKPYVAVLKGDVLFGEGSLPPGWRGGVAEAEIAKSDGRILR